MPRTWPRRPPTDSLRREFAKVIADFRPDLIHVNGSEYNYGWIISQVAPSVPTVLSIQGLLGPCAKVYLAGCGGMISFASARCGTGFGWTA